MRTWKLIWPSWFNERDERDMRVECAAGRHVWVNDGGRLRSAAGGRAFDTQPQRCFNCEERRIVGIRPF